MHTAPMGLFDVSGLTIREIDSASDVERSTFRALPWFRAVFARAPGWVSAPFGSLVVFVTDRIVRSLQLKAEKLSKMVVFLEGAKVTLAEEFSAKDEPPSTSLIEHLTLVREGHKALSQECSRAVSSLRRINPTSRAAAVLEQISEISARANAAAADLEAIAEQALHHYLVRKRVREIESEIDAKVDCYMEDREFDPELVALADAALARISSSSSSGAIR